MARIKREDQAGPDEGDHRARARTKRGAALGAGHRPRRRCCKQSLRQGATPRKARRARSGGRASVAQAEAPARRSPRRSAAKTAARAQARVSARDGARHGYWQKRDFASATSSTPRAARRQARAARAGARVRHPEARGEPPALRLPARARRRAAELGGAQGTEPRSRRQAPRDARRGPSARIRRLRRHRFPRGSTAAAR